MHHTLLTFISRFLALFQLLDSVHYNISEKEFSYSKSDLKIKATENDGE